MDETRRSRTLAGAADQPVIAIVVPRACAIRLPGFHHVTSSDD